MNDCMSYKSQLQGNPTFTCFVEPHSREQIWCGWLLSSQEPKIRQLEQVYQGWAWSLDLCILSRKTFVGCFGSWLSWGEGNIRSAVVVFLKKIPSPSAPLIHTAWPQAGGLEHFLKNNGSVCLQSHDLFLLIKTNILYRYNTKKWGKWEGFEKWSTFVNYLILFVFFPRCHQPLTWRLTWQTPSICPFMTKWNYF